MTERNNVFTMRKICLNDLCHLFMHCWNHRYDKTFIEYTWIDQHIYQHKPEQNKLSILICNHQLTQLIRIEFNTLCF